jgi:hypothetical protein
MLLSLTLRRLDDRELDAWIRAQSPDSRLHERGIREFRRRQEACHREHDILAVQVGLGVSLLLASAAMGVVFAAGRWPL